MSSWLPVAGGLGLYVALLGILSAAQVGSDLPAPVWVARVAPLVLYTGLVLLIAPGAPWSHRIGVTVLLWAIHLALATVTAAAVGAPVSAQLAPILAVSALVIPLRDLIVGGPRRPAQVRTDGHRRPQPDGARPASEITAHPGPPKAQQERPAQPPPKAAPVAARARTTVAVDARPTQARPAPVAARTTQGLSPAGRGRTAMSEPSAPAPVTETPRSTAPHPLEVMLADETSAQTVRVSFERIAAQIPPAVFRVPVDEVGASLREPGQLLVAQRLVLAQLAEGVVRAGWETVTGQFPRDLLAMTDEEITRALPDGQIVLPLDELFPQLPRALFDAPAPSAAIEGIESFPAPFRPVTAGAAPATPEIPSLIGLEPGEGAEPATGSTTANGSKPALERDPAYVESAGGLLDGVSGPVPPLTGGVGAPGSEPPGALGLNGDAGGRAGHALPDWLVDEEPEGDPVAELLDVDPDPVSGGDAPALSVTEAPALDDMALSLAADEAVLTDLVPAADEAILTDELPTAAGEAVPTGNLPTAPPAPAEVFTPRPVADADWAPREDARAIAACLAPLGPVEVAAAMAGGAKLFTILSGPLTPEQAAGVALLLLPLLRGSRAPRPEQLTLRGRDGALVVTPLGSSARAAGAYLVAALPPGGRLALLELLSRRAAAAVGDGYPDDGGAGAAMAVSGPAPELLETDPPARVRHAATTLDAFGPVAAHALCDADGRGAFYLFLPAGGDTRAVAACASEIRGALRAAAGLGAVFHTAVLRCGQRRLIVRLDDAAAGGERIVVAEGETTRPGLAHRQLESVAVRLGGH